MGYTGHTYQKTPQKVCETGQHTSEIVEIKGLSENVEHSTTSPALDQAVLRAKCNNNTLVAGSASEYIRAQRNKSE